ncbi:MAG: hypothetical protein KY462_04305 [Actinobacteria bacterium]|nr:hypothetical protein [Actinomycetota bacterium]
MRPLGRRCARPRRRRRSIPFTEAAHNVGGVVPSSWSMDRSFAAGTVASAFAIYLLLIAFSRVIGLRAFS